MVTKRFYPQGVQVPGATSPADKLFYTRDHLGSVRELTDNTGALRARYDYDPYGRVTKVSGDLDADFGYTGHYYHAASGLYLTLFRAYDSNNARWLGRDPIAERDDINLYGYVNNDPINGMDPLGLWVVTLRLNFTATILFGVNLSAGITFDGHGHVGLVGVGQPPNAGVLSRINAIGLPPGIAASLTGGLTVTDADTICDQLGRTNSVGFYAGADGFAGEGNYVCGNGQNDSSGDTYNRFDLGVGIGTPGLGVQGSITNTALYYQFR